MLHAGKPAAGSAVPTELTGGGRIGAVLRLGQAQGQSAPANAGGTGKQVSMPQLTSSQLPSQQIHCPMMGE